ncbi:hypothetical protein WOLCODRAFT_142961 [Wolfiporia cocos MD-104 SS10]|uniref:Uncharacterized protein n=1 Tax=Wolfiporia cocos (strain MD-104) TaxID=742152 RepID=A0A2H3JD78_WOLCO|nr:hypothetical protein WOLCODRAFT_142961 [Wolfiporia cocos MD-104 SS10]
MTVTTVEHFVLTSLQVLLLAVAGGNAFYTHYAPYNPLEVNKYDNGTTIAGRDVYNPTITHPDRSTKWTIGSMANVTWSTSDIPHGTTDNTGKVVLGYLDDDDASEHLDLDEPLAEGLNITQGYVEVLVPNVRPGDNYIVVLLGDSGNRSPTFTIVERF